MENSVPSKTNPTTVPGQKILSRKDISTPKEFKHLSHVSISGENLNAATQNWDLVFKNMEVATSKWFNKTKFDPKEPTIRPPIPLPRTIAKPPHYEDTKPNKAPAKPFRLPPPIPTNGSMTVPAPPPLPTIPVFEPPQDTTKSTKLSFFKLKKSKSINALNAEVPNEDKKNKRQTMFLPKVDDDESDNTPTGTKAEIRNSKSVSRDDISTPTEFKHISHVSLTAKSSIAKRDWELILKNTNVVTSTWFEKIKTDSKDPEIETISQERDKKSITKDTEIKPPVPAIRNIIRFPIPAPRLAKLPPDDMDKIAKDTSETKTTTTVAPKFHRLPPLPPIIKAKALIMRPKAPPPPIPLFQSTQQPKSVSKPTFKLVKSKSIDSLLSKIIEEDSLDRRQSMFSPPVGELDGISSDRDLPPLLYKKPRAPPIPSIEPTQESHEGIVNSYFQIGSRLPTIELKKWKSIDSLYVEVPREDKRQSMYLPAVQDFELNSIKTGWFFKTPPPPPPEVEPAAEIVRSISLRRVEA